VSQPTSPDGTEVEQVWTIPHPDDLTMAQLDEVTALSGVDPTNPGSAFKLTAALVTWVRRRDGEPDLTYDEVYATLRNKQIRVTPVDPTNG
jgi:hypothetical protein